ncbi:MAG: hypothetical protein ACOYM3_16010 [Terrimicrobiaceae bacterium]
MSPPPMIAAELFMPGVWGVITGGVLAFAAGTAGWWLHAWRSPKLPDSKKCFC